MIFPAVQPMSFVDRLLAIYTKESLKNAHEDSNKCILSYFTKSWVMCKLTSAFVGVCKQKHLIRPNIMLTC